MTKIVRSLLTELRSGLETLYLQRLRGLYLYGSHARGEGEYDSDVDLLVILDQIDAYGVEIDRTGELISPLSLRYGISISRVFITEGAWRKAQDGFVARVRQEVVAA